VPTNYIPSVDKGVRAQMERGLVAGCPVVDIKVTVFDGKAHSVDSSDAAFQVVGGLALKEAAAAGQVVLLEQRGGCDPDRCGRTGRGERRPRNQATRPVLEGRPARAAALDRRAGTRTLHGAVHDAPYSWTEVAQEARRLLAEATTMEGLEGLVATAAEHDLSGIRVLVSELPLAPASVRAELGSHMPVRFEVTKLRRPQLQPAGWRWDDLPPWTGGRS
jgi:hypothetical protein